MSGERRAKMARAPRAVRGTTTPRVGRGWHGVQVLLALLAGGCAASKAMPTAPQRPDIAPAVTTDSGDALSLDASQVKPMFTELLAVDLPAVVQVVAARNVDIQRARQNVVASRGALESAVGAAFPVIVPTALFEHVEGRVRATEGDLVGVGFNTFQPSVAVQWVINPGRVIFDIIAAKKRLSASEHQEDAVVLETLRRSAVQYYELVLTQAHVAAAHQAVAEAEELWRITRLRTQTGTGVRADELRAEARLAERRQDLVTTMRSFYGASVALAVTLHLDATVTLVPNIEVLPPTHLVRDDLSIDALLGFAVAFRPDLQHLRQSVAALAADRGATFWGAFGPQFEAGYQVGGISGHANDVLSNEGIPNNFIVNPASASGSFSSNPFANGLIREGIQRASRGSGDDGDQTFSFSGQQRARAGMGWRLSISAFGDLKSADARHQLAQLDLIRRLDEVQAQVVTTLQASKANRQLIRLANQQVAAAAEALRLGEANLRAGTMTTLDVLVAQDAVTQARLRYAEAVVRYNQSQVELLAVLGLLDESALLMSPVRAAAQPEDT